MSNGADYPEHIGLAWRKTRNFCAKARDIVVGAGGGHVLHSAASCDEWVLKQGKLACPVDYVVKFCGQEITVVGRFHRFLELSGGSFPFQCALFPVVD